MAPLEDILKGLGSAAEGVAKVIGQVKSANLTDLDRAYIVLCRNAPKEVLAAFYKATMKRVHPDKEGGSDEKSKAVNAAWAVIRDGRK